jgi:hypothetical protein
MIFAVSIFYLSALEYSVHRWVMHRPKSAYWQSHSLDHHRDGKNDDEYIAPQWRNVAIFLALGSLPMMTISLEAPIVLGALMVWWRITWWRVHLLAHGLSDRWVTTTLLCPWTLWIVRHHQQHHRTPAANFGAIFPVTDIVMLTFRFPRKTS